MIRFATVFGFIILRISQCSSNIAQVLDTFPRQTVQRLDLYSKENVSDLDLEFLVDLKIPFRIHQNTFDLSGIEKQHLVWVNDVKASDMLSFVSNTSNAVLTHNYWFLSVDNNTNIPEYFTTNTKRFSLNIQLFFVLRNKSQIIVKQVVGTATTKVQIQELGAAAEIDWMAILETTRKRRDYNGIAIKAHFGDWPPFCICPTKNFYSGAFLDTFQIAAKQLNLTYIIQPPLDENWNIWARRLSNGTYVGMIREIIDARVDTSIAGFVRDVERDQVVDFTPGIFKSILTLVVRKPSRNDFSMRYFVLEFTPYSWALILLAYLAFMVCFTFITYFLMLFNVEDTKECNSIFKKALISSLEVCLRAFVSKGSTTKLNSKTSRLNIFCVLLLGFLIICYYRAQMNAALNVFVENLPVSNWKDVANSDLRMLIWQDTSAEALLKRSSPGSILRQIYDERIAPIPADQHLQSIGYSGAIPHIINGSSIAFIESEPYLKMPEYPCQITFVKEVQYPTYITFPFTLDSPFLPHFNQVLREMMQSGTLNKIWDGYQPVLTMECEEKRVSFGYGQLMFPVSILLIGASVGIILAFSERLSKMKKV